MSLLNDMLRDLSQRQAGLEGAPQQDENCLQATYLTPPKHHVWAKLVVLFVVVFCAVLMFSYLLKPAANTSVATLAVSSSSQMAVAVAPHLSVRAPSLSLPPALTPAVTTGTATADSAIANSIDDLLQQAERAMSMNRLTAPVEDNAYAYYQKLLSLHADNEAAKEGLDKIAQRYLTKAQEQSQLGNLAQAEVLVQRARFVSARFVDAHTVEFSELSNPTESLAATQQLIETPVDLRPAETIKPFVVTEAHSEVKEASIAAKNTSLSSVVTNAGWKDEQLVRHAQDLIQTGKQAEAQILLKNFVASEQKPALSAALLTELYIQQANTAAADITLAQANYLAVDVKSKLKAHILSLQGDDVQAITLLEKNLTAADVNEGYRALLASLYHKTANYPQSLLSYQGLINSFGDKPAYWLGVALAYDGLSQPKNALQAYLHLREFPQLQVQVKQYTDQRIATLRGE